MVLLATQLFIAFKGVKSNGENEESLKVKQNFLVVGEGGFKIKPSVGGAWIFSGRTHYIKVNS